MAYIEREAVLKIVSKYDCSSGSLIGHHSGAVDVVGSAIYKLPAADVAPVKHGHIVWKEYHKGGIRRRKCLQEIKSVYIEQQMPCKHIAITDERYLSKDPYCSECGSC